MWLSCPRARRARAAARRSRPIPSRKLPHRNGAPRGSGQAHRYQCLSLIHSYTLAKTVHISTELNRTRGTARSWCTGGGGATCRQQGAAQYVWRANTSAHRACAPPAAQPSRTGRVTKSEEICSRCLSSPAFSPCGSPSSAAHHGPRCSPLPHRPFVLRPRAARRCYDSDSDHRFLVRATYRAASRRGARGQGSGMCLGAHGASAGASSRRDGTRIGQWSSGSERTDRSETERRETGTTVKSASPSAARSAAASTAGSKPSSRQMRAPDCIRLMMGTDGTSSSSSSSSSGSEELSNVAFSASPPSLSMR